MKRVGTTNIYCAICKREREREREKVRERERERERQRQRQRQMVIIATGSESRSTVIVGSMKSVCWTRPDKDRVHIDRSSIIASDEERSYMRRVTALSSILQMLISN